MRVELALIPASAPPMRAVGLGIDAGMTVGHDQPADEMLAANRAPRGRSLPFDAIEGNKAGIPTGGAVLGFACVPATVAERRGHTMPKAFILGALRSPHHDCFASAAAFAHPCPGSTARGLRLRRARARDPR